MFYSPPLRNGTSGGRDDYLVPLLKTKVRAKRYIYLPLKKNFFLRVAILSPPRFSKFLSYLTGWISVIAWQAAMASGAFLAGTIIQGLLVLNYPSSYQFQRWHGTLLFYAIASLGFFFNTYLVRLLPRIESSFLVIHILGFFGILIPLTYLAPHGSVTDVFRNFNNGGGWSTTGLSFFVGLTTSLYAFIGKATPPPPKKKFSCCTFYCFSFFL